jgi:hypothetical protein
MQAETGVSPGAKPCARHIGMSNGASIASIPKATTALNENRTWLVTAAIAREITFEDLGDVESPGRSSLASGAHAHVGQPGEWWFLRDVGGRRFAR